MFTVSFSVFKYWRTYATLFVSVASMNVLAHLQSNMLQVTRPVSGYILPTIIGIVIGLLLSSNRVSWIEKSRERKKLFINIVHSLSIALDERDAYTYGHSSRVTELALALGKRLGLKQVELEMLELGSILHDIGKIGVPDTILNKPAALNAEEIELVRQHPIKGERIIELNQNKKMHLIVDCIRNHHEHYDGSGYPDGLKGEDIPVLARIVAITDAFDAMTSLRTYRKKRTQEEAIEEILRCSGSQFDPHMAGEFSKMMRSSDFSTLSKDDDSVSLQACA